MQAYPPELGAQITGLDVEQIREVAGLWESQCRRHLLGHGHLQHTTDTDNCRCLMRCARSPATSAGRAPGLHPLRGQNNVRAHRRGADPDVLPGLPVGLIQQCPGAVRAGVKTKLNPDTRLTVTEVIKSILDGSVRGMYMLGENPFLSDPNINKVRKALSQLDFLVVQDIFLTETAEFADVVLPAWSAIWRRTAPTQHQAAGETSGRCSTAQ